MLRRLKARLRPPPLPRPDERIRAATYPPPYPNGWYVLLEAHELRPGQTRFVQCLGEQLVVFRSDVDGRVAAFDAYCPHMGANLAGGTVSDGRLVCPFHRWCFAVDGQVVRIPYADRVPHSLRTRPWPVCEHDGMICLYYGRNGADPPPAEAPYPLPVVPGIADGSWVYRGRYDGGVVRMHVLEFAENSVDFEHFPPVHGQMVVPWTRVPVPGVRVLHRASWEVDAQNPHQARFRDSAMIEVLGRALPRTQATGTVNFIGPGGFTRFDFEVEGRGRLALYHTHTPIAPMEQQVRFRWYAERTMSRLLVSYVVGNWIGQWQADLAIWENKAYRAKPMVIREDGPIHELRRWYRQFYEPFRAR